MSWSWATSRPASPGRNGLSRVCGSHGPCTGSEGSQLRGLILPSRHLDPGESPSPQETWALQGSHRFNQQETGDILLRPVQRRTRRPWPTMWHFSSLTQKCKPPGTKKTPAGHCLRGHWSHRAARSKNGVKCKRSSFAATVELSQSSTRAAPRGRRLQGSRVP